MPNIILKLSKTGANRNGAMEQKPFQKHGQDTREAIRAGKNLESCARHECKGITTMYRLTTNRGFWLAFLLTIVTCGIYGLYLIHAYAKETNIACSEDGKQTKGLLVLIVLSIITFGIYGIVWYCQWINRCNTYLAKHGKSEGLQVSTYLLTLFLFGALTFGIMYIVVFCKQLYLQNAVNSTYNEINNL